MFIFLVKFPNKGYCEVSSKVKPDVPCVDENDKWYNTKNWVIEKQAAFLGCNHHHYITDPKGVRKYVPFDKGKGTGGKVSILRLITRYQSWEDYYENSIGDMRD